MTAAACAEDILKGFSTPRCYDVRHKSFQVLISLGLTSPAPVFALTKWVSCWQDDHHELSTRST
jgi:hypothetical protein